MGVEIPPSGTRGAIGVEARKIAVTPQTLSGKERATAWERITRERPNFAGYELKTDRDIPVVRVLSPAERSCTDVPAAERFRQATP